MGVPDPDASPSPPDRPLARLVEDQSLAVLAAIDDLRHDLPGSVHDARVALRKLRSTLVVFEPLLDAGTAAKLDEELRWFAGELGGARDAQVVRSRVTSALHSATSHEPPEGDTGAADLLAELDGSTAEDWDRARLALEDPRLRDLTAALGQVRLGSLAVEGDPRTLVSRVGTGLGNVVDRARHSLEESDDERLHKLRKRVKRVRFAVAAMRDSAVEALPAGSGGGRVVHALEELQDLLGEYQDAVVTAGILDRIGSEVPRLAGLAADLAASQRAAAAGVRESLPAGVKRVRRAARRLQRRTPGVHLD